MTQPREPGYQPKEEFVSATGFFEEAQSVTFAQSRARLATEEAETEGPVSNTDSLESTEELEDNPACPICGTSLQEVPYGMPTAEAADSGKYLIMGCTINDYSPSEKWFCPECGVFVA
jgi:rubredoxin